MGLGWLHLPRWAERLRASPPASPLAPVSAPEASGADAASAPPAAGGPGKVERTLPLGTKAKAFRTPSGGRGDNESIQVTEPLVGADTHQAQGFCQEVAELLTARLEADPARLDLHRTLLEVFRAAGDAEGYVRYAQLYYERSLGGDGHWPGIAQAGRELLPGHALFDQNPGGPLPKKFQRFYETVSQPRLHEALRAMNESYEAAHGDAAFEAELYKALAEGARRPTPLTALPLSTEGHAGAAVYAKREDVRAAHDDQLINAIGQTLLGQRLGRRRIVSATRDGIHGLVVASVATRHGLDCTVFMAEPAYRRHYARVLQMQRLGAEVRPVAPAAHVDAAWQAALQEWLDDTEHRHYVSSLEAGPHPLPLIVRDFQSVVGQEARVQLRAATGGAPAAVVAGVADGYLGLGLVHAFLGDDSVALHCVETPEPQSEAGAARFLREHRWLRATRRVQYVTTGDEEAMAVVESLFRATGMCVALESARTLAYARQLAATLPAGRSVLTLIGSPEEKALPAV